MGCFQLRFRGSWIWGRRCGGGRGLLSGFWGDWFCRESRRCWFSLFRLWRLFRLFEYRRWIRLRYLWGNYFIHLLLINLIYRRIYWYHWCCWFRFLRNTWYRPLDWRTRRFCSRNWSLYFLRYLFFSFFYFACRVNIYDWDLINYLWFLFFNFITCLLEFFIIIREALNLHWLHYLGS